MITQACFMFVLGQICHGNSFYSLWCKMGLLGQQQCAEKEGGFSLQHSLPKGKAVLSRAKDRTLLHSEAETLILPKPPLKQCSTTGKCTLTQKSGLIQTSDLSWWMQSITLPQVIFSRFFILIYFEKLQGYPRWVLCLACRFMPHNNFSSNN